MPLLFWLLFKAIIVVQVVACSNVGPQAVLLKLLVAAVTAAVVVVERPCLIEVFWLLLSFVFALWWCWTTGDAAVAAALVVVERPSMMFKFDWKFLSFDVNAVLIHAKQGNSQLSTTQAFQLFAKSTLAPLCSLSTIRFRQDVVGVQPI